MNFLEVALNYQNLGYIPIPILKAKMGADGKDENKKPPMPWKKYQNETPTKDKLQEWSKNYPDARIALITGEKTNLTVLDCDTPEAKAIVEEFLSDTLLTPIAKSPRGGEHYYFQYEKSLPNKAGILPGLDVRNDGGYILADPSPGLNGTKYAWLEGLSLHEIETAKMPEALLAFLEGQKQEDTPEEKTGLSFEIGTRDADLFHTALGMAKGGLPRFEVEKAILKLAEGCKPPFSKAEALKKVTSAFERLNTKERNLTQDVRDWIESTEGEFQTRDVFEVLDVSRDQKQKVSIILSRLIAEKLIERTGRRTGVFRRVERNLKKMDIFNSKIETVDLKIPFGIDKLVNLMPGNIVVLGGSKDAGKTSFLLNLAKMNIGNFHIHYFNSEMGESELTTRLRLFDVPLETWRDVNFYERDHDFHDVIIPGPGNVNIIDFLEIYEDFWIIKKWIAQIWRKLQGALAVIAIQKPRGRDVAIGGEGNSEKARLYLSLENGTLKIVSGKNWKTSENPKGKTLNYKVVHGSKLIQVDEWSP